MLTGDTKHIGEKVAEQLGLDKVYAELLPADKVEKVEALFRDGVLRVRIAKREESKRRTVQISVK